MLVAVAVSAALIFFAPMWTAGDVPVMLTENPVYMVGVGLVVGMVLANVFNFKKRKLQVVLNRLSIFVSFAVFGFMVYEYVTLPEEPQVVFGLGLINPLAVIVLLSLANKAIIKDEELIRSADRIR
jgi:peptidoglycan/LPS O-acetylase OafA/YrhL